MNYKKVLNFISFVVGGRVAHFIPNTKQGIIMAVFAILIWAAFTIPLQYVIDNYKIVKR